MNQNELRKLLESAGFSQSEAARQVGVTDRSMRRYIAGDAEIPRAIALAILYVTGQKQRTEEAGAKISSTGRTVTFTTTVSRRMADRHFVLNWYDGKRHVFMTTVSESGARAHRHLFGKLTALLEGLK